jgi:spore coat assembly protein SafA
MTPETILVALAVVAAVALVAAVVWRVRRGRARAADRERGEIEARVAERVHAISYTSELAEPPERVSKSDEAGGATTALETGADASLAATAGSTAEVATEAAPARMVPIAAPDIDRVYAPRRPQPTVAAAETRPVATRPVATRARRTADARPQRRPRFLVPAAAAVLLLLVAVVAGGPIVRGLIGAGGTAAPTATQVAVVPTATAATSPLATPSPTPELTPSATAVPTPTPTVPVGGTPLPTPHVYVVRSGDTLWQIAKTFDIGLSLLISANPQIKDPSVILPGEQVTIPTPTPAP